MAVVTIVSATLFVGLLAAAAAWDLARYTIPNKLTICMVLLFCAYALWATAMPFAQMGYHLLAGLVALLAGFLFFALGWIGGGDAKLFAAAALWIGFPDLLFYALTASIVGGGLTLGILWFRGLALGERLRRQTWIMRLHDEKGDIPYGVALAIGALIVLPGTEITNRFFG